MVFFCNTHVRVYVSQYKANFDLVCYYGNNICRVGKLNIASRSKAAPHRYCASRKMSAQAESVIRNIIREITLECRSHGQAVSETLAAFMVRV